MVIARRLGAALFVTAVVAVGTSCQVIAGTPLPAGHHWKAPKPVPTPTPTPTASPAPAAGTLNAYVTGYGWPDNSPPGPVTSGPGGRAGGVGSFTDPITLAVGYVGGKPDFSYGTKFYIPNVRRYFVVGDTCSSCHSHPAGVSVWVDMWVGGNGQDDAAVLRCEDALTGDHKVMRDPPVGLPVVTGSLLDSAGRCAVQFGG